MEKQLQVGVISSTHGIRGEVKVFPTTNDAARFKELKQVYLDTGKEQISLQIERVKFFKQFVILKFKGFDNINDIECYKGKNLYVTRENAVKLAKNEYFITDLIGLAVFDEEENLLGELTDVLQTGANDVYTVKLIEGGEVLLPAIKQCILAIDMENRKMKVHVMEGLM